MRSPQRVPPRGLVFPAVLLLAAGCGGGQRPVKVEGVVTLDGKPLPAATVTFVPPEGGRPASGRSDADGSFRLTTFRSDDGAMPGDYKVIVVVEVADETYVGRNPDTFTDEEKRKTRMSMSPKGQQAYKAQKKPKSQVPAIYSDAKQTPLKETVPPAGKVELALRSSAR